MIGGPIVIELLWRDTLLAVVEEFYVEHSLHIHSASSFVCQVTALVQSAGHGWYTSIRMRRTPAIGGTYR